MREKVIDDKTGEKVIDDKAGERKLLVDVSGDKSKERRKKLGR